MFKRKSRPFTIRLSEEDYQVLIGDCLAEGASSLSEYARAKLFHRGRQRNVRLLLSQLGGEVKTIERALNTVSEQLHSLTRES